MKVRFQECPHCGILTTKRKKQLHKWTFRQKEIILQCPSCKAGSNTFDWITWIGDLHQVYSRRGRYALDRALGAKNGKD